MLRSLVYAIAFYVVTALMMVFGLWLLLAPRRWAMQGLIWHGRVCTWLLDVICGTRMEVRGLEKLPPSPCLIVAKHQSTWDSFALIPLLRDPAIVLKVELTAIPVYGWFCRKFEHIIVERTRAAVSLRKMVADAKARAAAGRDVVIFPEGTRQAPGAPPDYKPGYVALYEALGVPCVPIALNSGLYWPRHTWRRKPGTIVVEFLDPIPPGLPRADVRRRVEDGIESATARLVDEGQLTAADQPASLSAH